MALPSQSDRSPTAGRTFVQHPGRGPSRPVIFIVVTVLVLVAVGTFWAFKPKGSTPPAATTLTDQPLPGGATQSPPTGESKGPLTKALGEVQKPILNPGSGSGASTSQNSGKLGPVDLTSPSGNNSGATNPGSTGKPGESEVKPTPGQLPASGASEEQRSTIAGGDQKLAAGDKLGARSLYNRALADSRTTKADQDALRTKLAQLNDDLMFSNKATKGDPFVEEYTVASGDNPTRIARKRDLATEPSLITRVNKVTPTSLKVGQKLKLVRGPFHAVVHKSDFRLDLYAGSPDEQSNWTYIKSFKVGLGTDGGTPTGTFTVKQASKLINPTWVNPRTGEKFAADDPKNPIGERWVGLEGVGASAVHTSYGLHGTIDPDSIGKEKSMGCVRMGSEDIALIYELLTEKVSVIKIEP